MSQQEKIQALVAQLKVYEAYLNDILAREGTVARLLEEGRQAIDALRSISGKEAVQALMPIGIGVYLRTSASPDSKAFVNIGAGIAIERSRDDAVSYVESRLKEMEVALRSMMGQKEELAARMEQTRVEVNNLLQKMQKTG